MQTMTFKQQPLTAKQKAEFLAVFTLNPAELKALAPM